MTAVCDGEREDVAWLALALRDADDAQHSTRVGRTIRTRVDWPAWRAERVHAWCVRLGLRPVQASSGETRASIYRIDSALAGPLSEAVEATARNSVHEDTDPDTDADTPPRPQSIQRTTSPERPSLGARCDSLVDRMGQLEVSFPFMAPPMPSLGGETPMTRAGSFDSALKGRRRSSVGRPTSCSRGRSSNVGIPFFDDAPSTASSTCRRNDVARRFSFGLNQDARRDSVDVFANNKHARESVTIHEDAQLLLQPLASAHRMSVSPRHRDVQPFETPAGCPNPNPAGWGAHPDYGDWGTSETAPIDALRALRLHLEAETNNDARPLAPDAMGPSTTPDRT